MAAIVPAGDAGADPGQDQRGHARHREDQVRSSANAEDVPNFDGAGLHDSFAADTDQAGPPDSSVPRRGGGRATAARSSARSSRSRVGCAIKGVYASLWNKRAVEERSFARIDQPTIAMGLAIVPAYDTESDVAANAVVVTRVLNTDDVFGYSLSVQQGNNLVTNPDPGTVLRGHHRGFHLRRRADQPHRDPVRQAHAGRARARPSRCCRDEQMLELVDLAKRRRTGLLPRRRRATTRDCRFVTAANDKDVAGSRAEDPRERAARLQAGPRVRRPLTGARSGAGPAPTTSGSASSSSRQECTGCEAEQAAGLVDRQHRVVLAEVRRAPRRPGTPLRRAPRSGGTSRCRPRR